MTKILRNVAGTTGCAPFMGTGIETNLQHFETAFQHMAAAHEEMEREVA